MQRLFIYLFIFSSVRSESSSIIHVHGGAVAEYLLRSVGCSSGWDALWLCALQGNSINKV